MRKVELEVATNFEISLEAKSRVCALVVGPSSATCKVVCAPTAVKKFLATASPFEDGQVRTDP